MAPAHPCATIFPWFCFGASTNTEVRRWSAPNRWHSSCTISCVVKAAIVRGESFHRQGRCKMNWDQVQGNWKQFTGKVKEKWGKLTDDDLKVIAGKRDQLSGILQKKSGYKREQA